MCVAQLETPSGLKPGLQLCGNSCHSLPLVSHCGLSSGRPTYGSLVPWRGRRKWPYLSSSAGSYQRAKDSRDRYDSPVSTSPAQRVAMKMGRRPRCSSVTYRFRYAPLTPVRLGPPCRRPILIATMYLLFRGQDTSHATLGDPPGDVLSGLIDFPKAIRVIHAILPPP